MLITVALWGTNLTKDKLFVAAIRLLWSRDQLSVNTKIVCFWKILLAGTDRAY